MQAVLLQVRPTNRDTNLGCWLVVGWDTRGMVLLEPMKGTRDNMLPGDQFYRMK